MMHVSLFVGFFPPLSIPPFHEYIDEGKQADNATSGVSDLLHVFILQLREKVKLNHLFRNAGYYPQIKKTRAGNNRLCYK